MKPETTDTTKSGLPLAATPLFGVWVDVNERRPEKMGSVLCACEGGNVDKSFYDPTAKLDKLGLGRKHAGKWGRYFELAKMGYKITHWMPLPPPPKVY